jgi:hypothetical protein
MDGTVASINRHVIVVIISDHFIFGSAQNLLNSISSHPNNVLLQTN